MRDDDLRDRLSGLSSVKRALYERLLEEGEASFGEREAIPRWMHRDRGPLTPTQRQLWRQDHSKGGDALLNMCYAVRLEPAPEGRPLDARALRRALADLQARHEPLRSVYEQGSTGVVVRVLPSSPLHFGDVDLRGLRPEDRERQVQRWAAADLLRAFDLAHGPVWRGALLRLESADAASGLDVLLLGLHHVCGDAWSMEVFSKDLSELYRARVAHRRSSADLGAEPELPPLERQCIDWAAEQERWLTDPEAGEQLAWWQQRLARPRPATSALPYDKPRLPVPYLRSSRQVAQLPAVLVSALRDLGSQLGTSLFTTLLAGFAAVLARWRGDPDVLIGSLAANRPPGSTQMLGAHYNTIVVRADLGGDPDLVEVLERLADCVEETLQHQRIPFPLVAELYEKDALAETGGSHDHKELHRAMLVLDKYPLQFLQLEGLDVRGLHFSPYEPESAVDSADPVPTHPELPFQITRLLTASSADLTFFLREAGDALTLSAFYKTDLFDDRTIAKLILSFIEALVDLANASDTPLSQLSLSLDAQARVVGQAPDAEAFPQTAFEGDS